MAARKQNWHPDGIREKIKVSQLVNRLNKFIKGEIDLTSQQVRAIEILLKKTVPDLSSVEAKIEDVTESRWIGRAPSEEEFESKHNIKDGSVH